MKNIQFPEHIDPQFILEQMSDEQKKQVVIDRGLRFNQMRLIHQEPSAREDREYLKKIKLYAKDLCENKFADEDAKMIW